MDATLVLANGEHPKVVQERLGHSSIEITMDTYSHVVPSMREGSAANLRASLGVALAEVGASSRRQAASAHGPVGSQKWAQNGTNSTSLTRNGRVALRPKGEKIPAYGGEGGIRTPEPG